MITGPKYLLYLLLISFLTAGTDWRTLHSSKDRLTIEVIFDINPDDKLEPLTLLIGLPANELPSINVRSFNKRKMGIVDISDNGGVKWINQQKVRQLETATLEIHPQANGNYYFQNFIIDVYFQSNKSKTIRANKNQRPFLKQRIMNWDIAQNWFQPQKRKQKRYV